MRLVLASRNAHKALELEALLAGHEVVPLPDDVVLPPEDGDTFEANALGKARAAATALDAAVIADDSGIEAQALGGRPGVRSARFAGEHATDQENLAKLLAEAPAHSPLRYVCSLVLVDPGDGTEVCFEGICTGTLEPDPRGSGGFGYDPAFLPDDVVDPARPGRTMAELAPEEKAAISHRGRAAARLAAWLEERVRAAG